MSIKRLLRKSTLGALSLLGSERALRVMFRLDQWLYYLEGQMAIEYGKGVHTKHGHMNYHDFFIERIHSGERVLDVGCGSGVVAHEVATRTDAQVTAIDIKPENISEAISGHSHPNVTYVVGDITTGFLSGSFEVVMLSNVLEHIEDRTAFLQRLVRATRPSRLLIRVPVFERDWRVPLKRELGVEWRLDEEHYIEYTLESFADEMAAAELAVVYQESRWGEIWAEVVPKEWYAQEDSNPQPSGP